MREYYIFIRHRYAETIEYSAEIPTILAPRSVISSEYKEELIKRHVGKRPIRWGEHENGTTTFDATISKKEESLLKDKIASLVDDVISNNLLVSLQT